GPLWGSAMSDLELSRFCCQNRGCRLYGQRGQGNISVRGHYGKNNDRPMLYCRTCGKRFSAYRGTPLYNSRLSQDKVEEVLAHIDDGCGVRATARLTGVCQNTVIRYSRKAGEHAQAAHDELVGFSPLDGEDPTG